ncbi:MAG TPA: NapC/NirT family cytochrome c [Pyrinomonadaceae bacterium]|nr:NapC/NirT family cytochrome c [Pyrinomonadaceae bacterium]
MSEAEEPTAKLPSLFRNYVSFVGAAITTAALVSVVLLFLVEITSKQENPYLGILTYIIFPAVLIFGLVIVVLGMLRERRRRHRGSPAEIAAYPRLDLNDSKARHAFFAFLLITFLFVCASAFGSYKGYEYTESDEFCGETCHSVMKPEYVAYKAGAHARVGCVGCHVGPGADWYVRSKLSGAYQLYSVTFNKFSRPITTPVHNLRPAPETCEQCHWPEKFFGAQLKVFNHYAYDEKNTLRQTRMLLNVGGGSPTTGQVAGIHWHMNIANKVDYISIDDQRQVIPWVRIQGRDGNVVEYHDRSRRLTQQQIDAASKRRMDCVDCHNRPAHVYQPPDVALDQAFSAGRLDPSLPFLKRQAVEVLNKSYATEDEALRSIATSLDGFYKSNYSEVYAQKSEAVKGAVNETQRIFKTYFFPEMKTNWSTHPNNIGHFYSSGCFRCHDGEHVSDTGKVIRKDCDICHTVIYDSANPAASVKIASFRHPVDLGALSDRKCETCHKANEPFKHPVNLGDISMFQCAECHPKKP